MIDANKKKEAKQNFDKYLQDGLIKKEIIAFYSMEMDKRSRFQYSMTETIQEQKANTSLKRAREFMLEMKKLLPEFKRGESL